MLGKEREHVYKRFLGARDYFQSPAKQIKAIENAVGRENSKCVLCWTELFVRGSDTKSEENV